MNPRLILATASLILATGLASAHPYVVWLDSTTPDKTAQNFGVYLSMIQKAGKIRLILDVRVHSGFDAPYFVLVRFSPHTDEERIDLGKSKKQGNGADETWYRGMATLFPADLTHQTYIEFDSLPWNAPPLGEQAEHMDATYYRVPLDLVKQKKE